MANKQEDGEKEMKSRYFSLSLPQKRKMGNVHSVFKTSFNLVIDNQLFNFSEQGMPLSVYGCLLDKNKMAPLLKSCKPGNLVRLNNKIFTIYTINGTFQIDLSDIKEVDLSIPILHLSQKEIKQTSIYHALQEIPFNNKIGLKNNEETEMTFQVLKVLSDHSNNDIKKAINYLIGRGEGLTPSGDDFLIGYTMIRKAFLNGDTFEKILKKCIDRQVTTDISQSFYKALFDGFVSSLFVSLIWTVEGVSQEEIEPLLHKILLYGHTSGYDTLFGFYLGLQSLITS